MIGLQPNRSRGRSEGVSLQISEMIRLEGEEISNTNRLFRLSSVKIRAKTPDFPADIIRMGTPRGSPSIIGAVLIVPGIRSK